MRAAVEAVSQTPAALRGRPDLRREDCSSTDAIDREIRCRAILYALGAFIVYGACGGGRQF